MPEEFDRNYQKRADDLIEDAITETKKNNRFAPSVKGYWHANSPEAMAAKFGVDVGRRIAVGAAAAAITGAGVAAGAVSFGIAPALGIALGVGVNMAWKEISYQGMSKKLIHGISYQGEKQGLDHPALLGPAAAKIGKKLTRVNTRKNEMTKWRHLYKRKPLLSRWVESLPDDRVIFEPLQGRIQQKPDSWTNDKELQQRLLELRYYAQMTFNYVNFLLSKVIEKRNAHIQDTKLIYGHVIRQVHLTGNHAYCEKKGYCQAMSHSEIQKSLGGPPFFGSYDFGQAPREIFQQSYIVKVNLDMAIKGVTAQRKQKQNIHEWNDTIWGQLSNNLSHQSMKQLTITEWKSFSNVKLAQRRKIQAVDEALKILIEKTEKSRGLCREANPTKSSPHIKDRLKAAQNVQGKLAAYFKTQNMNSERLPAAAALAVLVRAEVDALEKAIQELPVGSPGNPALSGPNFSKTPDKNIPKEMDFANLKSNIQEIQSMENIGTQKPVEGHLDNQWANYGKKVVISDTLGQATKKLAGEGAAHFAAAGSSVALGAFLINEVQNSVRKRLQKKSILSESKVGAVFNLAKQEQQCEEDVHRELSKILKKNNIIERLPDVAKKCHWYLDKINELEKNLRKECGDRFRDPPRQDYSRFNNCSEAYHVVFSLNYIFKQYQKLIVYLTYFEIILLVLDKNFSKVFEIPIGSIVDSEATTIQRPRHMRDDVWDFADEAMHSDLS